MELKEENIFVFVLPNRTQLTDQATCTGPIVNSRNNNPDHLNQSITIDGCVLYPLEPYNKHGLHHTMNYYPKLNVLNVIKNR